MDDKEKKEGKDKKLEVNDSYFYAPKFVFEIPKKKKKGKK